MRVRRMKILVRRMKIPITNFQLMVFKWVRIDGFKWVRIDGFEEDKSEEKENKLSMMVLRKTRVRRIKKTIVFKG